MAKEERGWDCDKSNPDGSRSCKRFVRTKEGEEFDTGLNAEISVDPSTCETRIMGVRLLDSDWKELDEIARRVGSGCKKRNIKKGYS